jgi:hypothetical protein
MKVVVEVLPERAHEAIQFLFASVGQRWMSYIVRQGQRLGQILVDSKDSGHRARDLRYLDGVGQPVAEMVGEAGSENLGLVFEAAERPRVDHAIAVTLEFTAVGMRRLGISPASAAIGWKSEMDESRGGSSRSYFATHGGVSPSA